MRPDLSILLTRPYWLDEWHAVLVANRGSAGAVLSDLRQGSDFAPPFLHLALWTLRVLAGGTLEPWMTRVFTIACTLAALWFVYATLRRRLETTSALVGSLAVAVTPVVLAY